MDRRKLINVNRYESLTDAALRQAVEEFEARVCPKVRVADALNISKSGLPDEVYSYALKAHFDFVVVDKHERVAFAIEFDEQHHRSDSKTIRRDRLKNSVCEMLGMPLLRITGEYLDEIGFDTPWPGRRSITAGRFASIIGWLARLWFLEEAFYRAQERGEILPDEPFIWHNIFDYDPVIHAWSYIRLLYEEGRCLTALPEVLRVKHKDESAWSALAVVNLDRDEAVAGYAQCRSINYTALSAWELCEELAVLSTARKLKKHFSGDSTAHHIKQIDRYKERLLRRSDMSF